MVAMLRSRWHPDMSFDAMVELRDDLDAMLQRIRSERHIRPPFLKCPHCGQIGEGAAPHVSTRAMILSLLRFDIASAEPAHILEKAWAAHRKANALDLYGKALKQAPASACPLCASAGR